MLVMAAFWLSDYFPEKKTINKQVSENIESVRKGMKKADVMKRLGTPAQIEEDAGDCASKLFYEETIGSRSCTTWALCFDESEILKEKIWKMRIME